MVTVFGHGFVAEGTEPLIPRCALRCTEKKSSKVSVLLYLLAIEGHSLCGILLRTQSTL